MHQAYMLLTNLILSFVLAFAAAFSDKRYKAPVLYIGIFAVDFFLLSGLSAAKPVTFLLIPVMFLASFTADGLRPLRSAVFSLIFALLYGLSIAATSLAVGVSAADIFKYADVYIYNSHSLTASLFICAVWIYLTLRRFAKRQNIIACILLSAAVNAALVWLIYVFGKNEILIYSYSACLVHNIVTLLLAVTDLYRNKAFENELSSRAFRLQSEQYKLMLDNTESTKRIAHNMNNLMLRVTSLIDEKSYGELREYIYNLNSEIDGSDTVETGSRALSAVLTYKRNELKHKGVDTKLMIGDNLSMLSDEEIFVLFGNLLDNAGRAASDSRDKYVHLSVFDAGGYKNIKTVNSVSEGYTTDFKTTDKADRQNHGIGMGSILSIVNSHGGVIDCYIESGEAHINISVPNN